MPLPLKPPPLPPTHLKPQNPSSHIRLPTLLIPRTASDPLTSIPMRLCFSRGPDQLIDGLDVVRQHGCEGGEVRTVAFLGAGAEPEVA